MENAVSIIVYRLIAGATKTEWQAVAHEGDAQVDLATMQANDPDGQWGIETITAWIPQRAVGAMGGYLIGSRTGGAKASQARANGKLSKGRPKKPNVGLS